MTILETAVRQIARVLAVLSAGAIVVMVVAIACDVIVRNTTGASVRGMLELAETSLVISVFFGLAWAGVKGEHVCVTLLVDRFHEAATRLVQIVVWALSTVFISWLLYATVLRAIDSTTMREERFGLVRWPIYPMRWVIVAGLVALLLVALLNLARSVAGRLPMGPESELQAVLVQQERVAAQTEESLEALDKQVPGASAAETIPAGGTR
ncbi:TRAP transporter small permease [Nesterenkonia populi]|uniref:TRAP transporter small permease n=1 Tax=Nesterenkonia populi TaxID=1591087 RepID=UPI0011BF2844|nr:TRAP transporter small permease [Nesterenkonia populi]